MRFLSVAVFGDHLYFTEENTHSLFKYNRLTGSRHALTSDLDFSLHLKVIHPILQNPGRSNYSVSAIFPPFFLDLVSWVLVQYCNTLVLWLCRSSLRCVSKEVLFTPMFGDTRGSCLCLPWWVGPHQWKDL